MMEQINDLMDWNYSCPIGDSTIPNLNHAGDKANMQVLVSADFGRIDTLERDPSSVDSSTRQTFEITGL